MAISKTFETLFRLNAKWIGGPGVAKAQAALHRTAAVAQHVNVKVKGLGRAVFGGTTASNLFSRAVGKSVEILQRSVAAASDAQEAHDNLALSMERNTKFYSGLAGKTIPEVNRIIAENVEMLIKQSEQMEKTGHDAETLQAGWEKMIGARALSPEQVKEQAQGFSDMLSRLYGANATQEESVELGQMVTDLILEGNLALVKRLDLGQAHLMELKKINKLVQKGEISAEAGIKRRQKLVERAAKTLEGETARAMEKPSGKIAQMHIQIENLLENMGKPFVKNAGSMADSFRDISVALGPTSETLAKIVDVQLKALAKWLAEHKAEIPEWLNNTWRTLKDIDTACASINKILTAIDDLTFGPLLKLLNLFIGSEHIFRAWAPGTIVTPQVPKAMDWRYGGTTGQPTTTEAANRQLEESRKAAEKRQPGYPPYQTESQALQKAMRPTAGGPVSNATIAAERASRVAEIQNNPALKKFFAAAIAKEAGTPTGVQAVTEALFNRAQQRGKGIQHELTHGFYGPVNRGEVQRMVDQGVPDWAMKQAEVALEKVAGGSNLIEGRTDQGMINEIKGPKKQFGGEWFGYMPGTQGWSEEFNRRSLKGATSALSPRGGPGGGTQNISMNSPVTVNGVAPGREQMVARQVRTAVRDPMRQLLDQIKAARNYESRLGYV